VLAGCAAERPDVLTLPPAPAAVDRPEAPTDIPDLKDTYDLMPVTLVRSIAASSVLPDPLWGPEGFAAWHLLDGEPELPWCAARRLLGIGEEIEIEYLHPVEMNEVVLSYPDAVQGPRVVQIEIVNDQNESRTVDVDPASGRSRFVPVSGRRFRVVIRKTASRGEATLCIGEILFRGRAVLLDTRFPPDAEPVALAEIRAAFADIESYRQPSLGRPKLVRAMGDFFRRWTGPGELASARLALDYRFQAADLRESEENLCVVAVRAVVEASGIAERLFRERFIKRRSVPLLESCVPEGKDLSYWAVRQTRMAVLLFTLRGDDYGALEAGDPRALPRLLSVFRRNTRIGWWRAPLPGYGDRAKSPADFVRQMPRESVRRILDDLILLEDAGSLYRNGLEELRRGLGT